MSRNKDEMRKLSQKDGNRFCMNCRMRGPVYVVLDFGTFVCSSCASMHRTEQHKVRGITMTEFTDDEVARVRICGNDRAEKVWLRNFKGERPSSGNEMALRKFFTRVYVNKEFASSAEFDNLQMDLLKLQTGEELAVPPTSSTPQPKESAPTAHRTPSAGASLDIFDATSTPSVPQQKPVGATVEDDMFSDFTSAPPPPKGGAAGSATPSAQLTASDLFGPIPQQTPQINMGFAGVSGAQFGQASFAQGVAPQHVPFPSNFPVPNYGGMPPSPFVSVPAGVAVAPCQSFAPYGAMPMNVSGGANFHQPEVNNQFSNIFPTPVSQPVPTATQNDAFASLNPFGKKQ